MPVDGARLASRHESQALKVSQRQLPLDMEQIFSKATEMVYVLKKHPNQSDYILPSQLVLQWYSMPVA